MNLTEAIDWGTDQLTPQGIEDARQEAEIILVYALGIKKSELILNQSLALDDKGLKHYRELIGRRLKHEPTAYITGYQPFLSMNFTVNRSVLIPRPETELLAEQVIKVIKSYPLPPNPYSIVDVGTGSGAIAVCLAGNLPGVKVIGIEASSDALKVAQKNAADQRVADRCQFIKGNLLEPVKEKVNIIVSNPPYIPSGEINRLQPEVKDWEPRQALDGGKDGLDFIRKLLNEAPNHLSAGQPAYLFMEFGFGQAGAVESLAKARFKQVEMISDYAGIPRILKAF